MDNLTDLQKLYMKILPLLRASGAGGLSALSGGMASPLSGQYSVSQGFGNYNPGLYQGVTPGARHQGVDFRTPVGTMVRSPISGTLRQGYDPGGYGRFVEVAGDGTSYRFSHLSQLARALQGMQEGGTVRAGQTLAKTGGVGAGAGRSTGAHLDVSVRRNGQYIDPLTTDPFRKARR